ncbi:MAG TPA: thiamine pyrophosphate-binding protein [Chloroflexota bacterium]|jgi:acetolactate synthase-1/2/3 large subunit
MDGGQLAARFLAEAGIRHIFTVSGGPLNPLYNGCQEVGIDLIHTRHDGAAGFMAEGHARASRGPAVCAVTLGTGVAMVVPAVLNAHLAATPLVVIAGAAALPSWDRRPFAQADQLALMKPITKWARTCHATARLPEYLAMALREATTGRPGPVFLEIPSDVMAGTVEGAEPRWPRGWRTDARVPGDPARVREALAMVARAERPVAIVGSGVWWSDGAAELRAVVERLDVPLFSERLGRGTLPADHRLNGGLSAVALNDAAIHALRCCDLLLVLGARFDYLIEYGDPSVLNPSATVVQIDLEPEEIGAVRGVDLGIVGDLRTVLAQMLAELESDAAGRPRSAPRGPGPRRGRADPRPAEGDRGHAAWVEELQACRGRAEAALAPLFASDETPIHPVRLIAEIRRFLDDRTIVVTSGGDVEQWGRWLLEPRFPGGSMRAGQTGSLGVDVPYCIAARLARPDKRVILLTGDGGFAYHVAEFDTAARHAVPFVAVVADDAVWAQIKHELDITYGPGRDGPVRMAHRRWDRVVEALGGHGEHVERPEEIHPAIERALASGKPACVHVVTRPVVSPETLWAYAPQVRASRLREA